jgi:hypothetical protein
MARARSRYQEGPEQVSASGDQGSVSRLSRQTLGLDESRQQRPFDPARATCLLSPYFAPPSSVAHKEARLQGFRVEPTGIEPVTSCLQIGRRL